MHILLRSELVGSPADIEKYHDRKKQVWSYEQLAARAGKLIVLIW